MVVTFPIDSLDANQGVVVLLLAMTLSVLQVYSVVSIDSESVIMCTDDTWVNRASSVVPSAHPVDVELPATMEYVALVHDAAKLVLENILTPFLPPTRRLRPLSTNWTAHAIATTRRGHCEEEYRGGEDME